MSVRRDSLSVEQARRIALGAQAFGVKHSARTSGAQLLRLVKRLGAVQIDSVNVLVRSQYLPVFSRLGAYERFALERLCYCEPRRLFEYWGHEASLVPMEFFPLFRWRMEGVRKRTTAMWSVVARIARERPKLVTHVLKTIERCGPMSGSDFQDAKGRGKWWGWSDTRRAIAYLFWAGDIMPTKRLGSFERVYDVTERVIPAQLRDTQVDEAEAHVHLIDIAARACGIATETDLRDYFRMPVAATKSAIRELLERGTLMPVLVEGWKAPAYLHAETALPKRIDGSALLSPFDSLVWNRERTQRLFGFHYRIEIYTPAHRRTYGYYVLPYLLDERLVARVDLKAARERGTLLVHAIHYEPGVRKQKVRRRLQEDLAAMARWLGLERVKLP